MKYLFPILPLFLLQESARFSPHDPPDFELINASPLSLFSFAARNEVSRGLYEGRRREPRWGWPNHFLLVQSIAKSISPPISGLHVPIPLPSPPSTSTALLKSPIPLGFPSVTAEKSPPASSLRFFFAPMPLLPSQFSDSLFRRSPEPRTRAIDVLVF